MGSVNNNFACVMLLMSNNNDIVFELLVDVCFVSLSYCAITVLSTNTDINKVYRPC